MKAEDIILTNEDKILIYKNVLIRIKASYYNCVCISLDQAVNDLGLLDKLSITPNEAMAIWDYTMMMNVGDILHWFPEFLAYKPNKVNKYSLWWLKNNEGQSIRIDVLDKVIKSLRIEIDKTKN